MDLGVPALPPLPSRSPVCVVAGRGGFTGVPSQLLPPRGRDETDGTQSQI